MRFVIAILALAVAAARAEAGTLQARLIRGTGEAVAADQRLADIEPALKKQFGYEHFQQIGAQPAALDGQKPQRLNLGEGFVVFVTAKPADKGPHEINFEWYSGRVALVKSTAKIGAKNSLFVKGPGVGKDWIILALTVRE